MLAKVQKFVKILFGWVKIHEVEIILAVGAMLISLLSFAIGYLTAKEQLKEPIQIEKSQ